MQQGFRVGLITQRLDENEWCSAERATVQHSWAAVKEQKIKSPAYFYYV